MDPKHDRKFEQELEIDATPEAVWKAVSTEEGVRTWFAPEVEIEPGVGGSVRWRWDEICDWPLRVTAWEPGLRLGLEYDSPVDAGDGGGKVPLFVDFTIEAHGARTVLRLVHSGFGPSADFDEEFEGIGRGWPVELGSLAHVLENHPGAPRYLTRCLVSLDRDPDEVWGTLTGPDGLRCGTEIDQLSPGESFRLELATGDVLEGTAIACHDRELSGAVGSHGNGWFRASVETYAGRTHVWLWLATYGLATQPLDELGARWEGMLAELFDVPIPAAS